MTRARAFEPGTVAVGAIAGRGSASRRAGRLLPLLAGLCLGCGGEEGTAKREATMVPHAAVVEEASGSVRDAAAVARIEAIELTPRRAVAGARLRARARLAPHPGVPVEVDFRWETASGRLLAEGAELDTRGLEPGTIVVVSASPRSADRTGETASHRLRLVAPEERIGLVAIDARDGRSVGSLLRAVVETTDDESGFAEAELEWRIDGKVVGVEEELDTSPFAPGDVVELRARLDGEGGRPIAAEPVLLERSAPPEIVSRPLQASVDGAFRYAIEATSPARGAVLRYELLKGPQGMVVDAETGVVEWRPARGERGRFEVEVAVMDQWGSGVAQRFALDAGDLASSPASPAPPR